jgi:glycosyltransferase involved in cell wall biosynthesis
VTVVRNGIALSQHGDESRQRESLRREFGVPLDAFVIGSVGRYASEKCYSKMVEAFAAFLGALEDQVVSLSLVLVGDGPDRPAIEASVAAHGLEGRVTLTGMTDRVADWLSVMDVFALSSMTEGTSITLLEAAALGLPLVVTDVGGNREVLDQGNAGLIVPYDDAPAMAGAFLGLYRGAELRYTLGLAAGQYVKGKYGIETMLEQYEAIYREALGAGPWHCLVHSRAARRCVPNVEDQKES